MKKLIPLLTSAILAGCATAPDGNLGDRFYDLVFEPLYDGLVNEYDTDGDGTGDLMLVYEITGQDNVRARFELRAIKTDKNRNGFYEDNEVQIIPPKSRFVKL